MNKPFVFVLMPFDSAFNDIYKLGIKAACSEAGMYSERVDEQQYEERMLDRIYNQINKADYIIADMTGRNPNVFYETGYAHALQKKVILAVNSSKDIPFDLKHHPHIIYNGSISNLKDELINRLKWFSNNPGKKIEPNIEGLKFSMEGQVIETGREITCDSTYHHIKRSFPLSLDILNQGKTNLKETVEFGLQTFIVDNLYFYFVGENNKNVIIPDVGIQYYIGRMENIYPNQSKVLPFQVFPKELDPYKVTSNVILKIYSEMHSYEIPFILTITQSRKDFGKF